METFALDTTAAPERKTALSNSLRRKISVVIAEANIPWHITLRGLLKGSEFEIVGEAVSDRDVSKVVRNLRPEILLLDVNVAGGAQGESIRPLTQVYPGVLVVLTASNSNQADAIQAMAVGATGYVARTHDRAKLLRILRTILCGHRVISM